MAARVALMSACDHCLLRSYLILIPVVARLVISVCRCKRLDLCWPQWIHFGSQERHRTSWNSTEPHEIPQTSWNSMEGSGTWQDLLAADK
jgi:hypothetical protein